MSPCGDALHLFHQCRIVVESKTTRPFNAWHQFLDEHRALSKRTDAISKLSWPHTAPQLRRLLRFPFKPAQPQATPKLFEHFHRTTKKGQSLEKNKTLQYRTVSNLDTNFHSFRLSFLCTRLEKLADVNTLHTFASTCISSQLHHSQVIWRNF